MGTRAKPAPRPDEGDGGLALLGWLRPAAIAAALTLLGAPYLGIVWQWIAPSPTYVNVSGEVFLENQDSSEFVAADGWFLLLGLAVGVASAAVAYWRWRGHLGVIVAMTGAAVLGALIAREVGEAFGPAPIEQTALTLGDGETVAGSIKVAANAVLLGWPVGILITYLSLVGGLERNRHEEEPATAGATDPAHAGRTPSAAEL